MTAGSINRLVNSRSAQLRHYAPLSFFRQQSEAIYATVTLGQIDELTQDNRTVLSVDIEGSSFLFLYRILRWDSDFFQVPTIRLEFVLFEDRNYGRLVEAIGQFVSTLPPNAVVLAELPSEDIIVIQALNESRFRLVETRLTYYLDLHRFKSPRFPVRKATARDIPNLKKVASQTINPFDRFHADISVSDETANRFLGVFVEESINGFADYVMVPDDNQVPADSFLTAKYLSDQWDKTGVRASKMVLSAVSPATNRGWYVKLISEMAFHLSGIGADFAYMHPATTNRAVIHTYEKLGCKFGKASHILSYRAKE